MRVAASSMEWGRGPGSQDRDPRLPAPSLSTEEQESDREPISLVS